MLRKEIISDYVKLDTEKKTDNNNFGDLGIDAHTLSLDLHYQRSNISKDLNDLWRKGILMKITGRPTLYVYKQVLEIKYPSVYFPTLIQNLDFFTCLEKSSSPENTKKEHTNSLAFPFISSVEKIVNALSAHSNGTPVYISHSLNQIKPLLFNEILSKLKIDNPSFKFKFIKLYDFKDFISFRNLFENLNKNNDNIIVLESVNQYDTNISTYLNDFLSLNLPGSSYKQNNKIVFCEYFSESEKKSIPNNIFDIIPFKVDIETFGEIDYLEKAKYINLVLKHNSIRLNKNINVNTDVYNLILSSGPNFSYTEIDILFHKTLIELTNQNNTQNLILNFKDIDEEISTTFSHLESFKNLDILLDIDQSFLFYDYNGGSSLDSYLKSKNFSFEKNFFSDLDFVNFSISSINKDIPQIIDYFLQNDNLNRKSYVERLENIFGYLSSFFNAFENINTLTNTTVTSFVFYSYCLYLNEYYRNKKEIESDYYEIPTHYEILWDNNLLEARSRTEYSINLLDNVIIELNNFFIQKEVFLLLIVDNSKDETLYETIINSYDFHNYFILNSSENLQEELIGLTIQTINRFSSFYNFLIITDQYHIFKSAPKLNKKTLKNLETLYPLSIPLIDKSLSILKKGSAFEDFRRINSSRLKNDQNIVISDDEQTNFMDMLNERILKKDLIFLDSEKSNPLLFSSLNNICLKFNLVLNNSLITKFITHCSFMIERLIQNESMKFENLHNYYSENIDSMNYIKKELIEIERAFGISISPSELAFINEIFN